MQIYGEVNKDSDYSNASIETGDILLFAGYSDGEGEAADATVELRAKLPSGEFVSMGGGGGSVDDTAPKQVSATGSRISGSNIYIDGANLTTAKHYVSGFTGTLLSLNWDSIPTLEAGTEVTVETWIQATQTLNTVSVTAPTGVTLTNVDIPSSISAIDGTTTTHVFVWRLANVGNITTLTVNYSYSFKG